MEEWEKVARIRRISILHFVLAVIFLMNAMATYIFRIDVAGSLLIMNLILTSVLFVSGMMHRRIYVAEMNRLKTKGNDYNGS